MSHDAATQYPYLGQLLGAYLHWDWQSDADTIEDVMQAFTQAAHAVDVWATVADIRRFLTYNAEADAAYAGLFPNGLLPAAWSMSAREWLQWLDQLIVKHAPLCRTPPDARIDSATREMFFFRS